VSLCELFDTTFARAFWLGQADSALYLQEPQGVDRSARKIKPAGYADDEIVIQQWDEILRMIATIKLNEVTASALFRRLNSYSKQHALYRTLKAFFGQIPKSLFILQ
jgi:TnpA family transposase